MISLFIFRSNARGMQYGIGTYIHELTHALLKYSDLEIFVVSYQAADTREFSMQKISDRFYEIKIPGPSFYVNQSNSSEKKYAASVVKILSNIVSQKEQAVFQFNYIDDLPIIKSLKQWFNFSVISIVHFAQWQQLFEGNRKMLTGLNLDTPTNNIEFTLSQEREMYSQSDHIVSVTRYMKDFLISEYGVQPEKISVIKNGLNHVNYNLFTEKEEAEIKRKFGFGEDEIIILFSGRIDPCKGIIFLMEAFEHACKRNNDLRLVLLGQGNIQDCQKKMQSCFGKATYTGFLPKSIVNQFYKVADIGIVPSVYDHCPYTVLEMIANKIPLIMSRINGLDELLSDEECLFINPIVNSEGDITFNIKELSEAILTLAGDKNLRARLAENSYKRFKRKFTATRMAVEMHRLFHSLTNHKKSAFENEKSERR